MLFLGSHINGWWCSDSGRKWTCNQVMLPRRVHSNCWCCVDLRLGTNFNSRAHRSHFEVSRSALKLHWCGGLGCNRSRILGVCRCPQIRRAGVILGCLRGRVLLHVIAIASQHRFMHISPIPCGIIFRHKYGIGRGSCNIEGGRISAILSTQP